MKKTLIPVMALAAVVLGGCSADKTPTPTPAPSVSVLPSETVSGWPTPPNITRPPYTPESTDEATPEAPPKTEPTAAPTTSAAVTPAVAFAQRWGKKYPSVPEFAILKAANATCDAIAATGTGWNNDAITMRLIEQLLSGAGMPENDATEFAQDAEQNYCASVANPT